MYSLFKPKALTTFLKMSRELLLALGINFLFSALNCLSLLLLKLWWWWVDVLFEVYHLPPTSELMCYRRNSVAWMRHPAMRHPGLIIPAWPLDGARDVVRRASGRWRSSGGSLTLTAIWRIRSKTELLGRQLKEIIASNLNLIPST